MGILDMLSPTIDAGLKVLHWLNHYGYLQAAATRLGTGANLEGLISYAKDLAVTAYGVSLQDISNVINTPRCGCSDYEMLVDREAATMPKWPYDHTVKFWVADPPVSGRLNLSAWKDVFSEAAKAWCQYGEKIKYQVLDAQPSDGFKVFNGREDGQNGVLAWCELPVAGVKLYQMKLDSSEDWGGRMDPLPVVTHEMGHGFGLSHISPRLGEALMNPTLGRLKAPVTLDVKEFQARYWKPVAGPTDPPPPPPTGANKVTVNIDGKTYVGDLRLM